MPAVESAAIVSMKQAIADKNDELYQLQTKVLQHSWGKGDRADVAPADIEPVVQQCRVLESELWELMQRLRQATETEKLDQWQERKLSEVKELEGNLASLQALGQRGDPTCRSECIKKRSASLAKQASVIEAEAEALVRQLHANMARNSSKEFDMWRRARLSEIHLLEMELLHAREKGADTKEIEEMLKVNREELDSLVREVKEDSTYVSSSCNEDDSDDSDHSDEEEQEQEQFESQNKFDQLFIVQHCDVTFNPLAIC